MPHAEHPDPTRAIALFLLHAVLDQHYQLDAALAGMVGDSRDRAAGHRLAATVLRRLGTLDAVLEPWLRRAPPIEVRHVLRLGAAGLLMLKTPPHAAVATGVSMVRDGKLNAFAGLVNAVLRSVALAGQSALDGLDGPRLDTPAWLWASWGAEARAIAIAHSVEAPLDVTLRSGAAVCKGCEVLPTGSVRLPPGTRIGDIPGFAEGLAWVQDAAAAMPAKLLAPRSGEVILDLCAAPGGKTAQLAASGAMVTAIERDRSRMRRLRNNLARLHLAVECVEADATIWRPQRLADAVLLDAPCSATGTIRRHPDVPHLKRPGDLARLTAKQDQLLLHARSMLRVGGRLIYAVCSLQPEEGAARIKAAVECGGWRIAPFEPNELSMLPEALTSEGFLRTHPALWPDRGGMDGFFAARLIRLE